MIVFLNGRYLPEEQAHISISDHGFLYGDGLYETLRGPSGKTVFLREHLARFAGAASTSFFDSVQRVAAECDHCELNPKK